MAQSVKKSTATAKQQRMAQSVKTRRFSYTLCALRYALTRDPKSAVSFIRFALCAMRYALFT
jgi:hypothetical protein